MTAWSRAELVNNTAMGGDSESAKSEATTVIVERQRKFCVMGLPDDRNPLATAAQNNGVGTTRNPQLYRWYDHLHS